MISIISTPHTFYEKTSPLSFADNKELPEMNKCFQGLNGNRYYDVSKPAKKSAQTPAYFEVMAVAQSPSALALSHFFTYTLCSRSQPQWCKSSKKRFFKHI